MQILNTETSKSETCDGCGLEFDSLELNSVNLADGYSSTALLCDECVDTHDLE